MRSRLKKKLQPKRADNVVFLSGSKGVLKNLTQDEGKNAFYSVFKYAFDSNLDAIAIFDLKNVIDFVNKAFLKLFGYQRQEQLQGLKLENFFPPDYAQPLEEMSQNPVADKILKLQETSMLNKNGQLIPVAVYAFIIFSQQNQGIGLFCSIRDLTERKCAEQERQKLLAQFAQSEKMTSLGQFAAGIAHEINNPLAYLKANLKVLDEYRKNIKEVLNAYEKLSTDVSNRSGFAMLDKTNSEVMELAKKLGTAETLKDLRSLIKESEEGVERIRTIIQSLKRFTEPPKSMPELADVNDIIENILNLISSDISRKGRLVKDLGRIPRIQCHPQELGQVFINIISNAANAVRENGEILISTRVQNGQVQVKIQDNGIGMTPEQMSRIFDPFYSGLGVGNKKGLGLSVSYGTVKSHGGEILVESEPGKGSTFIVALPTGI